MLHEGELHWAAFCAAQAALTPLNTWLKWDRKRSPGCSSTHFQGPAMKLRHFPQPGRALPWRQKSFLLSRASNRGEKMRTESLTIHYSSQIPCCRFRGQPAGPRGAFPSWKLPPDSATHSPLSSCQLSAPMIWWGLDRGTCWQHPWNFPYKLNLFNAQAPVIRNCRPVGIGIFNEPNAKYDVRIHE